MPATLLTDRAVTKINAAAGSGTQVAISHVALGDGNGSAYNPGHGQTALRRELVRKPIDARHIVAPNAWRVKAEFGPETAAFEVREIGFFDGQGELICIYAGVDVVPRQTGAVTYLVDHVLSFSRVENGLILINAPDDTVFDAALLHGTAIARLSLEQLRQAARLQRLTGTY